MGAGTAARGRKGNGPRRKWLQWCWQDSGCAGRRGKKKEGGRRAREEVNAVFEPDSKM
jgi:hypothetical protein